MKVYTHINIDLDAAASVWAARQFMGAQDAELVFVPANWDGIGLDDGDLALDIRAGGRGIKGMEGTDGTVGSCFASIVANHASESDRQALLHLSRFVEIQDSTGRAIEYFAPAVTEFDQNTLDAVSINSVLWALQARHPRNDALIVERMSEIFSGMLEGGRARQRAEVEANDAELIGDGLVAIVRDKKEFATNAILFERGVRVIVYVDTHEGGDVADIGVVREGSMTLRMDDPALVEVIHAAGEQLGDGNGTWFAHPAGFLLAWGTRKAPATRPSRVRPEDLAAAAARLLGAGNGTDNDEHQNPITLSLDEAKELLRRSYRYESRDSAFGDSEVSWYRQELTDDGDDESPIAEGYFSREQDDVSITLPNGEVVEFTGRDASQLFTCGNGLGQVGENSSMPRSHRPI